MAPAPSEAWSHVIVTDKPWISKNGKKRKDGSQKVNGTAFCIYCDPDGSGPGMNGASATIMLHLHFHCSNPPPELSMGKKGHDEAKTFIIKTAEAWEEHGQQTKSKKAYCTFCDASCQGPGLPNDTIAIYTHLVNICPAVPAEIQSTAQTRLSAKLSKTLYRTPQNIGTILSSYLGGSITAGADIPTRNRARLVKAMGTSSSIVTQEFRSQVSKLTVAKCFRQFAGVDLDLLAYNLDIDERRTRGDTSASFLALENSAVGPLNQFFEKMEDQGY